MKRYIRILMGVLLMPFMYARYSPAFFLPILFIDIGGSNFEAFAIISFIYALFFSFIMGNLNVMNGYTKLIQRLLGVEYEEKGEWMKSVMHSHSIWTHPIIEVRGKDYECAFTEMGGALYDVEAKKRRFAIVRWLFN